MGIYIYPKYILTMLPNQSDAERIGHHKPNDSLYFHKNVVNTRSPAKPSWNEPYYQYRETKLEHQPKSRTSPTYQSSVFTPSAYTYNVQKQAMSQSQSDAPRRPETSYQNHYQRDGYINHSPSRNA